jgi:hypothetical protein
MAGAFELATRSAIREIILNAVQTSKFGYVMTPESLEEISDQLFDLLLTSRNLKAAGDRMLTQGIPPSKPGNSPKRSRY